MKEVKSILLLVLVLSFLGCGGSSSDTANDVPADNNSDTVNTDKLIETPFEGLTTGDDLSWYTSFRSGQYLTETVDYVPIPIFLAYFTSSEEETIKEGVTIANEGTGFDVFEVVDTWQDDARVIYKVDKIYDVDSGIGESYFSSAIGHTNSTNHYYEEKTTAGVIVTDWQIELKQSGVNKWTVAHELGHAFGITQHALIDYENDTSLTSEPNNGLEENSLMQADGGGSNPALNDYNYMMQMQGALLLRHLGETGL